MSVSPNIKINGVLGPVYSLKSTNTNVSTTEIGVGGTDRWGAAALDSDTTLGFVFDVVDVPREAALQNRFIQFRTEYTDYTNGKRHMRVTTAAFRSEFAENVQNLTLGFDQEAAACIVARMAAWRYGITLSQEEVIRSIDRIIIRTAKSFA